ncbi:MAG: ABC transporter ATP-binding protein [Clostridia bacterium]|nr:ABC transporter ATP-binding protein [Clostridia bacterium]
MRKLLEIKNLRTVFKTYAGEVSVLNSISLSIFEGEAVGIVGESGSGKSVAMLSVMKLLADNGRVAGGEILFDGKDITNLNAETMQKIRGNEIGMIFQDPMTSLNPLFTIGNQLVEAILKHNRISKGEAREKAINMLKLVGIPSPEKRMNQYPHEFSGGMRQRAMIAMALSCEPKLLIADEPTTALDVTIQAQILELMKELKKRLNTSILLITHDLGLVADICDRVIVMYGGNIVEQGRTDEIFYSPKHPYTMGLLKSIPRLNMGKERLNPIEGQPPDMIHPLTGCPFSERCPKAMQICDIKKPHLKKISESHEAACWLLYVGDGGENNEQ